MGKAASTLEDVPIVNEGEEVFEKFEDPNSEGFALNYIEKKGHDIRMKFLHTLAMMKILVPLSMKPKTHQTGKFMCETYKNSHYFRLG